MAKQALHKTVMSLMTVSDIKRLRLVYYIEENAVIIIHLHALPTSIFTIFLIISFNRLRDFPRTCARDRGHDPQDQGETKDQGDQKGTPSSPYSAK